jgi:hypothetical protein
VCVCMNVCIHMGVRSSNLDFDVCLDASTQVRNVNNVFMFGICMPMCVCVCVRRCLCVCVNVCKHMSVGSITWILELGL